MNVVKSIPKRALNLHPFLEVVADRIRFWRAKLPGLVPLALEPELESIIGSIEGQEIRIQNELFFSRGLRKLHLELAVIGNDLQILHCVFFPDPVFDIPIFGADIVVSSLGITTSIVDLSPVSSKLPHKVQKLLDEAPKPIFTNVRELPKWGDIFSTYVHFIRPSGIEEETFFLEVVDQYLKILFSLLLDATPDSVESASTIERYQGQINYCNQQKLNDKTKAVLSKAFGIHWAERYIEKMLFDMPPPLRK